MDESEPKPVPISQVDLTDIRLGANEQLFQAITPKILEEITPKIEKVLNESKAKLTGNKPSLLIKPSLYDLKDEELKKAFDEIVDKFPENKKYTNIVDLFNFIHYAENEQEIAKINQIKQIDTDYLSNLFNSLNDKGILFLFCDQFILKQIDKALHKIFLDKLETKFFIKLYIASKEPLTGFLIFQKLAPAKEPINILTEKLIHYEINEDLTIGKPLGYTIENLPKSIAYMTEMIKHNRLLSIFKPGRLYQLKIKETVFSENIQCSLLAIDTRDKELAKLKNCACVVMSKHYSNDYIYFTPESYLSLCYQVNASRVLLLRAAPFNYDSVSEIKAKMSSFVHLFKFKGCVNESIPVLFMNENYSENETVFQSETMIIRDVTENQSKSTYRQLLFKSNPIEPFCQAKLILTSKAKVKQAKDDYIQLPTIQKFEKKNLVTCLDDRDISQFYLKTVLSSILFLDLKNFPNQTVKILVLGGGVGNFSYYFDKILYGKAVVDNVEVNKKLVKLGKDYFGMNIAKENIRWSFEDINSYVEKNNCESYYDLIVANIDNSSSKDNIIPPKYVFTEEFLKKLNFILRPSGMFILNLMTSSYQKFYESLCALESNFANMFMLENNEDLNKIFFCFKSKYEVDEYPKLYLANKEILSKKENCDFELVEKNHESILKRVMDIADFKKKLETTLK